MKHGLVAAPTLAAPTLAVLTLAALLATTPQPAAQQYVVAGPKPLLDAVAALCRHRADQGLKVTRVLVEGGDRAASARRLQEHIHGLIRADRATPGYLLLVGEPQRGDPCVASLDRPGLRTYGVRYENLAARGWSDLGYVDIDDDGVPEWSCGRLPFSTAAAVDAVAAKIIGYDAHPVGDAEWLRETALIALPGELTDLVDGVTERAVTQLLRDDLDPAVRLRAAIGLRSSPFHVAAPDLLDYVLDTLNAGPLLTIYGGHGWSTCFAPVQGQPVLRIEDTPRLTTANRTALMAYAYNIASFDGPSLGAALLREPGGPAAVFAANAAAVQFGDLLLAHEMMRALKARRGPTRIGELVRRAKTMLMADDDGDPVRRRLRTLVAVMGFDTGGWVRRYTSDLFHLLGDPAMQLRTPQRLAVAVAGGAAKRGEPLHVTITCRSVLKPRQVRVELCVDRGRVVRPGTMTDVAASEVVTWREGDAIEVTFAAGPAAGRHGVLRVLGCRAGAAWTGGLRFAVRR